MKRLLVALLLILLVGACNRQDADIPLPDEKAVPAYGDTLIMGSIGDASNLLPVLASDSR